MRKFQLPFHTLLNLNVPDLPMNRIKGVQLTRQGFRYYSGSILRRKDHRGKDYFWVGGQYKGFKKEKGTDCFAVESGFASLTPLKLDSTDLQCLASFLDSSEEFDLAPGSLDEVKALSANRATRQRG
jgi:5'-nucleotidase